MIKNTVDEQKIETNSMLLLKTHFKLISDFDLITLCNYCV